MVTMSGQETNPFADPNTDPFSVSYDGRWFHKRIYTSSLPVGVWGMTNYRNRPQRARKLITVDHKGAATKVSVATT